MPNAHEGSRRWAAQTGGAISEDTSRIGSAPVKTCVLVVDQVHDREMAKDARWSRVMILSRYRQYHGVNRRFLFVG